MWEIAVAKVLNRQRAAQRRNSSAESLVATTSDGFDEERRKREPKGEQAQTNPKKVMQVLSVDLVHSDFLDVVNSI